MNQKYDHIRSMICKIQLRVARELGDQHWHLMDGQSFHDSVSAYPFPGGNGINRMICHLVTLADSYH